MTGDDRMYVREVALRDPARLRIGIDILAQTTDSPGASSRNGYSCVKVCARPIQCWAQGDIARMFHLRISAILDLGDFPGRRSGYQHPPGTEEISPCSRRKHPCLTRGGDIGRRHSMSAFKAESIETTRKILLNPASLSAKSLPDKHRSET